MKDASPQPIRLADYKAPNWLIEDVHLTFQLHPERTIVKSRIRFTPNPDTADRRFQLMGEDLTLVSTKIDGTDCTLVDDNGLFTTDVPDAPFTWDAVVEINPSANTSLDGLYMSNGIYCTQCEAEGFRKITYYPDRPDVMARFTVRIESDLPVLLSNGNPGVQGDGFAEWHDPWPKPSYLFALVAGDLVAHSGQHTTADGRDVALNIWVQPGDDTRCAYALDALKRSMVWDEDVYGRNYDLDVFNLVAISDFNAGAMENKGLNVFNASYVLASPETATDRDYEWIETVVAHEYFHNWTGNRITCRDWFQLCLKEGLTVFRDQQFSGDMRSHAVKRIDDVLTLRTRQFREDAGPLAHPVRPAEFIEINNFYTSTVYEKGAEVIGMLKTLVGDDAYGKALDLYFDRHDGQACTIEDWLAVFEDTTGRDLTQFARWYAQSGTPRVDVRCVQEGDTWHVTVHQHTPETASQPQTKPQVIPVRYQLYNQAGDTLTPESLAVLDSEQTTLCDIKSAEKPIVSAFRGFSAPVIVDQDLSTQDRLTLLAHDTDPFNRWEAGRVLAKEQLMAMITDDAAPSPAYIDALGAALSNDTLDPAFRAFALGLPSPDDMAHTIFDAGHTPDPGRIDAARTDLQNAIATGLKPIFAALFTDMDTPGPFRPDAKDAGRRALRIGALAALTRADGPDRARALFASADNMTETLGALGALVRAGDASGEVQQFYDRWKSDANVLNKWFSIQIGQADAETALATAETLSHHPDFHWKNPNRFRSVVGALSGNMAAFHHDSGAGYRFVAHWLGKLDPLTPQIAARLATVFETKRIYDGDRQSLIADALEPLRKAPSRNLGEILANILKT